MNGQPAAASADCADVAVPSSDFGASVPIETSASPSHVHPAASASSHDSRATAPATLAASLFDGVKTKITGLQVI